MGPGDDCYKVLGLPRSATDAEIRQAYKRSALRWHPDKNPRDRAGAEAMFKKVAAAYKVLIDPVQRRAFDAKAYAKPAAPSFPNGVGAARPPAAFPPRPAASIFGGFAPPPAAPAPAATSAEDAYNLFEEFFGKDPFKEFDSLFKDPSPENLDTFFSQHFSGNAKQGGAAPPAAPSFRGPAAPPPASSSASRTTKTTTTTSFGGAIGGGRQPAFVSQTTREERIDQPASSSSNHHPPRPSPSAPPPAPSSAPSSAPRLAAAPLARGPRVRCLAPNGVAYRRSADAADRLGDVRGPNCGDVVAVLEQKGDWVRCAKGWLPLTLAGQRVFELVDASSVLRARCLAAQGVAYRGSMDLDNRLMHVRGPEGGEVVEIEERFGQWLRTSAGWLPWMVGGEQVFELLDAEPAPSWAGPPPSAPAPAKEAGTAEKGLWSGGWSLSVPRWPFALFPVLGTGLYVTARASVFLFRSWCRVTFGMFPRLFW